MTYDSLYNSSPHGAGTVHNERMYPVTWTGTAQEKSEQSLRKQGVRQELWAPKEGSIH